MVLTLLTITLVSSTAVGLVYKVTQKPIAEAGASRIIAAIGLVLPEFDNDPAETKRVETIDGGEAVIYTATRNGEVVGYAIETFTNKGFNGHIRLMVGFLPDGTIYRVETIEHNETPGLGDKILRSKSDFPLQFDGRHPDSFRLAVTKDGGDVDAITAATITSRAYADAVDRAFRVFRSMDK